MTKGYIFDYGGTLDTAGRHWGKVLCMPTAATTYL